MASTGSRETPYMATFGHFFENRRFGLHFAGGMGQQIEKKVFRGKPPVMSGEVYRCPMDSPELCGSLEKNRQNIEIFGKRRGGLGEVGGTSGVPSHLISTHPVPKKFAGPLAHGVSDPENKSLSNLATS